jgi:hypothetical protein
MTIRSGSRRDFLRGATAVGAISVLEWLAYFKRNGVPGSQKDWGIAAARAQANPSDDDRYLVYWYCEGGWDAYSLFSPLATANHSDINVAVNELRPNPSWSQQRYRSLNYQTPTVFNGIEHGYLGNAARDMFPDMCVLSSMLGNAFHSGGRWELHHGIYDGFVNMGAQREADERTVMQAFAEAKGASYLLPHVSWHRWLADGELDVQSYPTGTGYYERLGPVHAHTQYGGTTARLRDLLVRSTDVSRLARRQALRSYTESLHSNFINDRDGQSVRAFASALEIHRNRSEGGTSFDVNTLFNDPALREQFGILPGDDETSSTSVNENPARSKETPHIRVQSMMAYELMRARLSCALFLENRQIRGFDSHFSRRGVLDNNSNSDQRDVLRDEVWNPLSNFVRMLKSTPAPGQTDNSTLYDRTTIVLCSEMGRTLHGDVESIINDEGKSVDQRYTEVLEQDVCQHWHVNSTVFMGGAVRGGTQFGRVGNQTMDIIPIMADGSLDPAYHAMTGQLNGTSAGFTPDAGHVYATALMLAGVDPAGKGRNIRPPLQFVKRLP